MDDDIANTPPHPHEPVGQETGPIARTCAFTFLKRIQGVSEVAGNKQEIIATVMHLISSGPVRLCDDAIEATKHLGTTGNAAA